MTEQVRWLRLAVLLGLGLASGACAHAPAAPESAELAALRKDFVCDPPSGYRPVPLVAKQDVPMLEVAKPTKKVPPDFPYIAFERLKYGEVQAFVQVNAAGSVDRVDIVSETPRGCQLAEATIEAFMEWEFEPGHAGLYSGAMKFYMEGN